MRAFTPEITKLKSATILTIKTIGNPNTVAQASIGALYGTAYETKFKYYKPKGKKLEIGCLAAEWPNAHKAPKSKWVGNWSLEISSFATKTALIQKNTKRPVRLVKRLAGTFAQVLHLGPYSAEGPTVKKLHAFVKEQGYKLIGPHEEVYLTRPDAKVLKTVIRNRVKEKVKIKIK